MLVLVQTFGVFALFLAMAAFVWAMRRHFARRYAIPESRVVRAAGLLLVTGVILAAAAYFVGRELASPVLFSQRVGGTVGMQAGDPGVVRTVRFDVPEKGKEYLLVLRALADARHPARRPVKLRARLLRPNEKSVFGTDLELHPVRRRGPLRRGTEYPPGTYPFTADTTGRFTVRIWPLSPDIAGIEVRLEDPAKGSGSAR